MLFFLRPIMLLSYEWFFPLLASFWKTPKAEKRKIYPQSIVSLPEISSYLADGALSSLLRSSSLFSIGPLFSHGLPLNIVFCKLWQEVDFYTTIISIQSELRANKWRRKHVRLKGRWQERNAELYYWRMLFRQHKETRKFFWCGNGHPV